MLFYSGYDYPRFIYDADRETVKKKKKKVMYIIIIFQSVRTIFLFFYFTSGPAQLPRRIITTRYTRYIFYVYYNITMREDLIIIVHRLYAYRNSYVGTYAVVLR